MEPFPPPFVRIRGVVFSVARGTWCGRREDGAPGLVGNGKEA